MSSAPEPDRARTGEHRDKQADEQAEKQVEELAEGKEQGQDGPVGEGTAKDDKVAEPAPPAEPDTEPMPEVGNEVENEAEVEAGTAPEAAVEPAAEPEQEPEPEPEQESEQESAAAEPVAPMAPEVRPQPAAPKPSAAVSGRRRLRAAMWPPRLSRGQLVVALLLFSLGLALAIQVRSTNDHDQLRGARQEDLVRILDELDSRQQRLQQEKAQLEQSLAQLENSSNQAKEAQEQTNKKATELGVLAGTVKATGPGIVLTVDDPQGQVKADMLLDTLQELRAAGAEAIQINDVRVVVNTYFTDAPGGGVQIDGKQVSQPYRFTVVGNPQDLTPALNIPGGVVRTLESHQARATIAAQQKVVVDALTELRKPQYAKPAAK